MRRGAEATSRRLQRRSRQMKAGTSLCGCGRTKVDENSRLESGGGNFLAALVSLS